MNERDDPLWTPDARPDEELARIEHLLGRYGVRARGLSMPEVSMPQRRRKPALLWALAAGVVLMLLGSGYQYRLSWARDSSWTAVRSEGPADQREEQLEPGQSLSTGAQESATIAVARIGRISLSPDSSLQLLETGTGKHRVMLEHGHMRARIWAPPGYFAVRADGADVVDLGCDFDLWKAPDGSGRVFVRSGWISYRIGFDDILVPEGYALSFADGRARTPLRPDAPEDFTHAVNVLEAAVSSVDIIPEAMENAARNVSEAARDQDAFTLLSLLSRWPALAHTMLYPRLAAALGVRDDNDAHRQAWAAGDQEAMDAWWTRIPRQPKQWWANWRDALG